MDLQPPSYTAQKHTESAYALVHAGSLPYESFSERSGEVVPGLYAAPESQLTDILTTDLVVDSSLDGYAEVTNEPRVPLRMTSLDPDNATPDASRGVFIYQYTEQGGDLPFSAYLEKSATNKRSVMVSTSGKIPIDVTAILNGGVRLVRERILGSTPVLIVNVEYEMPLGTWNLAQAAPNALFEDVILGVPLIPLPVGASGLRVRIAQQYTRATQLAFDVAFQPSAGAYKFPAAWSTLQSYPWPFLTGLPVTQMFRRICQDVLVTWTGSSLDNGGKVALGLTPSSFVPATGSPFTSVAALRVNRYDGPIKFGCHGTWRPSNLAELDRTSVFTYLPSTMKLVIGYSFADASGSARIRTFGMFGYTSDNPIIGRMIWVPAMTDAMKEALDLYYQNFPCCTNNKDHEILKSLKSAGKMGVRGLRALLEQDDKIAALAMMAGQPEIAAAVKVAGKINRAVPNKRKAGKQPANQSKSTPSSGKKKKKSGYLVV